MHKLDVLLDLLMNESALPAPYKDHPLKGEWTHYRDVHIDSTPLIRGRMQRSRFTLRSRLFSGGEFHFMLDTEHIESYSYS